MNQAIRLPRIMESHEPKASMSTAGREESSESGEADASHGRRISQQKEPVTDGTIVVKIGGSTLGDHDTTLHNLVEIQRQGVQAVVVHGGGKAVSEWMEKQGIRPRFVRGLRVTDSPSLDIAVAVLTGLVNKSIVASILEIGGNAIGLSGVDGGMLRAKVLDPALGLVGEVADVNAEPIRAVISAGFMPVIASVAVHRSDGSSLSGSLLNVNADTAAGEIAQALSAQRLVIMTDVEGVMDSSRRLIDRITERQAKGLIRSNVIAGGMLPKISACLTALSEVREAHIVDGRRPNALKDVLGGETLGTRVG